MAVGLECPFPRGVLGWYPIVARVSSASLMFSGSRFNGQNETVGEALVTVDIHCENDEVAISVS